MTRKRRGFGRHAFHQVTVADQPVGVMMNNLEPGPIVTTGKIRFGDGHAHSIAESLTERACGGFHAGSYTSLGMTRREAAPLAKLFDLFERQIIAGEIEQAVQQHRSVAGRQHESVSIEPMRIGGVMLKKSCPQDIGHRGRAQGEAWVTTVGLLHRIHRQKANRIDR